MGEYQGEEGIERKLGGNESGQKDSLDGWAIEPQPCPEQEEGRATLFCVGRQSSGIFFPSSLSNRERLPTLSSALPSPPNQDVLGKAEVDAGGTACVAGVQTRSSCP